MIYQIFKNTYRIPVKLQDKLEIPSFCAVCDYICSHEADSRQCVFESDNDAVGKKEWGELKSVSLFIPAPFPYVLVEQYELDETDLSNYVGFITEKEIKPMDGFQMLNVKELDKIIMGIKLDRYTRELAEKQKLEEQNNAKRRR